MINQNLKILLFCTAQDYNQAISLARYLELFSFMVVKAGIDQEETESSDFKKEEAVCRILRFWFIMKN